MTKAEIIKQEIVQYVTIPFFLDYLGDGKKHFAGESHYAMVDVDKLAALLAKYLDIKIEE